MKKVGIVSCYFKNNYGSLLQAYATKVILDNNSIPNETININNNKDFKKGKLKYYLTQILNLNFIRSKFSMIKLKLDKKIIKGLNTNINIRNNKYKEFRKEFNLSQSCTNYDSLTKLAEEKYSDIIVGSDQLWLPVNVVADYYTLNWVPDDINKISYSTSFGVSEIPEKYIDKYKNFLNRINHLSVRESSGVNIIKNLTNLEAKLVCDPTLLLTKNEWEKVAVKERIIKDKYILCYFLGNNIEHRKFVERLKLKTNYKIVSLNHSDEYVKYSDKFADIIPYDIGPREWINLIKNAEIVCTDSFHATVFSLIFNKVFYNFRRYKTKNKMSTNSRIDSLLNLAGVNAERILTGLEDIDQILEYKIDFKEVNKNLEKIRLESTKWLLNSVSYKKVNDIDNYIKISDKSLCSGCSACASICPTNAIDMARDREGFLYPKVDKNKCINCGMCKNVCPIINKKEIKPFEQKAYIMQHSSNTIRKESTSGGFYTAIGEYVISKGGIVYGASFDDNFIVKHTKAETKEDLAKFRKSKYVQSDLNNTFKEVKNYLNNGVIVCYSGTPCQIAGLKSFLQKEYNNLITIDIMCHSVPSPLFFEKYKKFILKKMNATKIISINFRDKSKYGYKYSMMTIKTDKGIYSEGIDTDPYLRAFFSDLSIRPACYNCQFKTQQRISDITIWDCFNISEINKKFDDDKGTTRILIQSEKGMKIINKLKNIKLEEISVDIATKKVKEMIESVGYNAERSTFFEKIEIEQFIEKRFAKSIKTRLNSFIRKFLSVTGIYTLIKKIAKRVLNK